MKRVGIVLLVCLGLVACGGDDTRAEMEDRVSELYCVWWADCWAPANGYKAAGCTLEAIDECSDEALANILDCFEDGLGQVPEIGAHCDDSIPCVLRANQPQCLPL